MKKVKRNPGKMLLLLAFLEGGTLMVVELGGAKMLAPFYGTSLYAWASTLAVTLGALTLGYYFGGHLTTNPKYKQPYKLFYILIAAGILTVLMPFSSMFVLKTTIDFSFFYGLVISQLFYLLPPVFLLGMVSPLIIFHLTHSVENSGKNAGKIYAISTVGGILATLYMGFHLIPLYGIKFPTMAMGSILASVSLIFLSFEKRFRVAYPLLFLIAMNYIVARAGQSSKKSNNINVIYSSEGLLGQVKVIDYNFSRLLLVNHSWMTSIHKDDPSISFHPFAPAISSIIDFLPKHEKVLLIGLGGGYTAYKLQARGMDFHVVDIDGRLKDLSIKYFGLKPGFKFFEDDGRHFINKTKTRYHTIIINALLSDNIPSHLLSIEAIEKAKSRLYEGGNLIIIFDGIEKDETGNAQYHLTKTLEHAGFHTKIISTYKSKTGGDLTYFATLSEEKIKKLDEIEIKGVVDFYEGGNISEFYLTVDNERLTNTSIFRDDKPLLEFLCRGRSVKFRNESTKMFNKELLSQDLVIFD